MSEKAILFIKPEWAFMVDRWRRGRLSFYATGEVWLLVALLALAACLGWMRCYS